MISGICSICRWTFGSPPPTWQTPLGRRSESKQCLGALVCLIGLLIRFILKLQQCMAKDFLFLPNICSCPRWRPTPEPTKTGSFTNSRLLVSLWQWPSRAFGVSAPALALAVVLVGLLRASCFKAIRADRRTKARSTGVNRDLSFRYNCQTRLQANEQGGHVSELLDQRNNAFQQHSQSSWGVSDPMLICHFRSIIF